MRYSFFLNNNLERDGIRDQSLGEKTPLIDPYDNQPTITVNNGLIANRYYILQFLGFLFLFISHTLAAFKNNQLASGWLDIFGSIFIFIYGVASDKMIPVAFMILWISVGIAEVVKHPHSVLNHTEYIQNHSY